MTADPWAFQDVALKRLHKLNADGNCGAFIDGWMGVGKTSMALRYAWDVGAQRTLVLTPLSVIPGFAAQVERWTPGFDVLPLAKGSTKVRASRLRDFLRRGSRGVVITNYDAAWRGDMGDVFTGNEWDLGVYDECHKIKAAGGKASRWVGRMAKRVHRRVGMSGTLMPHGFTDIYGQARAVEPSMFGSSFLRFRSRYAVMGGFEGRQVVGMQNREEFERKLAARTVTISRDVLDLLPVTHTDIPVEMPLRARKVYDTLKAEMVAQIDAGEITVSNAMTKLLRLQQISGGHIQIDGEDSPRHLHDGKMHALTDLLEGLPTNEPVVVFARFRADLDRIASSASRAGMPYFELSGRRKELEAWRDQGGVIGVQIQAGGAGIDLTLAAYCVYWSVGYSLGDYEQSLARVHRPGQERHVNYYHLITTGTVDRAVYRSLRAKGQVIEDVMGSLRRRAAEPASKE